MRPVRRGTPAAIATAAASRWGSASAAHAWPTWTCVEFCERLRPGTASTPTTSTNRSSFFEPMVRRVFAAPRYLRRRALAAPRRLQPAIETTWPACGVDLAVEDLEIGLAAGRPRPRRGSTSSQPSVHSANGAHDPATRSSTPAPPQSSLRFLIRFGAKKKVGFGPRQPVGAAELVVVGHADDGVVARGRRRSARARPCAPRRCRTCRRRRPCRPAASAISS